MNTDKIYAETIASEYAPKQTSKVVALKKLDRKAKLPSTIFAYLYGTICILIAGAGMSLSMQIIGEGSMMMALGIVLGVIGFAGAAFTYPIYKRVRQKSKDKYAYDIITLAGEITEAEE